MSDNERDEPGSIEKPVVARRLDKYLDGIATLEAVDRNKVTVASAHQALARSLQHQVGDDVVILYKGKAFVPYTGTDGRRCGYDLMPVYDLDAALIAQALDQPESPTPGANQP